MHVDYWLFDLINGAAGHYRWLDAAGQLLAVYGALAVILLALGGLWSPRLTPDVRRRLFFSLVLAGLCCALFVLLEQLIFPHDLRSRPANARWVTLLITPSSHLDFPAWPVAIAFALAFPLLQAHRRFGVAALGVAGLTGIALVFVGANFPYDVLTGLLIGMAVGYSAALLYHRGVPDFRRRVRWAALCWVVLLVWAGVALATVRPVSLESNPNETPSQQNVGVSVTPPAPVLTALQPVASPGALTVRAATNGHLLAAVAQVTLPDAHIALPAVEDRARAMVNAAFSTWPGLGLPTVEISAQFPQGTHTRVGALYTATVARGQWPAGGFLSRQPLPGKKFYHAQFYAPSKNGNAGG